MTQKISIPFNRHALVGTELGYIQQAIQQGHLCADGLFSKKCQAWLEQHTGSKRALLMQSGTDALEVAAILANIGPGDEVIMPSYTFVSTANAFVLRGGAPVFVDVRPDTLNLDETKIEAAITKKTKAIVPVHYGGVGCEMDAIMKIAEKYNLLVIEDAAQGIVADYKGKALGAIGHLGAISFHDTKNINAGEGGALLVNDARFVDRADVVSQKGTNRKRFMLGLVDKYTWEDVGSSVLPSELTAAFLWGQLEASAAVTAKRLSIWNRYDDFFKKLGREELHRRPQVPAHCRHNAHLYSLILKDQPARDALLKFLREKGIQATFHYVPLHSAKAGLSFTRAGGPLPVTEDLSRRLVRLPLWADLPDEDVKTVCRETAAFFEQHAG